MSDIRAATRQFRIQQWTQIIHDRAESGMTVKDYCQKNGLGRDAYFYWARIIKEQAIKERPDQQFVELPVQPNYSEVGQKTSPVLSELKLQIKDVSIIVTESTSPLLLSRTLEVLRNAL